MTPASRKALVAALSLMALSTTSHAVVIFNDTFGSGTGSWYKAGTENTLANSSGQLSWSGGFGGTNDAIRQVIGRSMAAQTLTVGQTIRLTFDYTQTSADTDQLFRVGLFNSATPPAADAWSTTGTLVGAYTGYYSFIRDNAVDNQARTESATDTNTTATGPTNTVTTAITTSSLATSTNLLQSTQYSAVFEVTLTTASQMNTVFTMNGYSVTGQTSTIYNGFDTVVLRSVRPVMFDNIQVEVIPEPSTALLGGLGLLLLLRRRR